MKTRQTVEYASWFAALRDHRAARQIALRIARLESGLFGDVKSVGGNVSELRIFVGAGYRVYFTLRGEELVILLCGGDKSTQRRDIERAQKLAAQIE